MVVVGRGEDKMSKDWALGVNQDDRHLLDKHTAPACSDSCRDCPLVSSRTQSVHLFRPRSVLARARVVGGLMFGESRHL